MELQPIADGLWRWTAPHPDWRPAEEGSLDDWERDVGSVLLDLPDATVLFDPLVPDDGWDTLDRHVEGRGVPVVVLTTIKWHRRSRDEVLARYDGHDTRPPHTMPAGVETHRILGAGEAMYWLPGHAALIAGDRLLGAEDGGLRLPPASWLRNLAVPLDRAALAGLLRPLLELPVRRVLVSHGQPVLEDGHAALARAIEEGTAHPAD
jgi:hypothetical protein